MFKIRIRKSIFYTLAFFIIILYSIMPIVPRLISTYLNTYYYMGLIVLTTMFIVFNNGYTSFKYYVSFLFPYILIKLLTYFTRTDSLMLWGYSILLEVLPILMGLFLIKDCNNKPKQFTYLIIFAYIVTSITTLIGLYQFPEASRWLATADSSQNPYLITYDMHNLGGYNFIYSLVLLYPLLIYSYKKKRIGKLVTFVLIGLTLFLLFKASYAIAFMMCLISTCLLFVKKDLRTKDIIWLTLTFVFIYVLFNTVISKGLLKLSSISQDSNMQERLVSLAGGYEGVENSKSGRIQLYRISINTFLANPIMGTVFSGNHRSSGHSFLLDFAASYGLIGLIFLIWFYKNIFNSLYKRFKDNEGYGYIVWTFAQAILLSTINTGSWFSVLCLYVPLILEIINDENSLDSK